MIYDCQMCGACCSPNWMAEPGTTVTYAAGIARPWDRPVICERLGLTDEELCKKYKINPSDGHMSFMKEPCRFLADEDEEGLRKCSIHDVKPSECRAYPRAFVYKNAENKMRFAARCPGLTLEPDDIAAIREFVDGIGAELARVGGDEKPTPDVMRKDEWTTADAAEVRNWVNATQDTIRKIAGINQAPPFPLM